MSLKKMVTWYFLLVVTLLVQPLSAFAYSYGNPNEEAVAQAYKTAVASLSKTPPDFAAAKTALESVKGELDMHMGPNPGKVIGQTLDQKNKEAAIDAFQKTMVLNIARRLDSIEKNFTDYKQSKLLLAKGLATYDALSPVVIAKNPALDQTIRKDFDASLQALGNPGLFGVGVKQPDQALFSAKKNDILKNLQEQFQLKSLDVGHFSAGEGPGSTQNPSGGLPDIGQLKNWVPLILILLVLAFIVIRTFRKRRK